MTERDSVVEPTADLAAGSDLAPGPDLAVVGTDTAVGKTVVTAGLTGWLREAGVDARAVKPAQTGYPPDDDAGFVADACGDPAVAVCHHYLEPALAPRVAAERVGVDLTYDAVLADARDAMADAERAVVEGIGGLRVPLAGDWEVLDLVADLAAHRDLEAVVVARSGLGTLNHTALTVDALRDRGVPVRAVVLNRYEGDGLAERTNPAELERMNDLPVYTVPPLSLDDPTAAVAGVREHLPRSVIE